MTPLAVGLEAFILFCFSNVFEASGEISFYFYANDFETVFLTIYFRLIL